MGKSSVGRRDFFLWGIKGYLLTLDMGGFEGIFYLNNSSQALFIFGLLLKRK